MLAQGHQLATQLDVLFFHGQLPAETKSVMVNNLHTRKISTIVATTALGMGVNLPNRLGVN